MAEVRLIDANALMEFARNHVGRTVDCNDIARFPTIDAVPVVRCRECKEYEPALVGLVDSVYCNVWQTVVSCNGYCDHGAKMDGGAE